MSNIRLPLILITSALAPLFAEIGGARENASLDELMTKLRADKGCARQVSAEEMTVIAQDGKTIANWIAGATPEKISAELPKTVASLSSGDAENRSCAVHVLIDVALRPDSALLLRQHVRSIGDVLNTSPDERLQRSAGALLTMLRPEPPKEVVEPLLAYLGRPDRDTRLQAAAVGSLLRVAPQDDEVISRIQMFWSRPLDILSKQSILNGFGHASVRDPRLVAIVIEALRDGDSALRLTALQVIERLGPDAIRQAAPTLRTLSSGATSDEKSEQVRRKAKLILATIEHS